MARVRYPRVSVGDGRFCYAGPSCKLHGITGKLRTATRAPEATAAGSEAAHDVWSDEGFAESVVEAGDAYASAVRGSQHVRSLDDMGGKALLKGYLARMADDGDGFYVYKADASLVSVGTGALFKRIAAAVEDGSLSADRAQVLRGRLSAYMGEVLRPQAAADKKLMDRLQDKFRNGNVDSRAYRNWEKQRAAARVKQGGPARIASDEPAAPPLVSVDSLSEEQLLEYYQCGRKRTLNSAGEAAAFIREQGDPGLHSYSCRHCGKLHAGHGSGDTPVETQLVSARRQWEFSPGKANLFAFSKGLV